MRIRRRLVVHGVVQGVGFRAWVWRAAVQRGVAGSARNRLDGTVEVVLEGEPDAVEAVVRACREGPRGAVVTEVELFDEEPEGLTGFSAG
ncbi:MAG TPA: acylphosphatase [Gaiellaceae bacterium]|nr:acylphosphatase [Gaiellaceae bacterium]